MDNDTGLIEDDIPTVLDYLFTTYGKVTAEEVNNKEAEVLNISFNPADPLVTIYRPIKQLQKKATEAGIPHTPQQMLELGLAIPLFPVLLPYQYRARLRAELDSIGCVCVCLSVKHRA